MPRLQEQWAFLKQLKEKKVKDTTDHFFLINVVGNFSGINYEKVPRKAIYMQEENKKKPTPSLFCFLFTQLKGSTKLEKMSQNQLCLSNIPHSTGLHPLPLSTHERYCVK